MGPGTFAHISNQQEVPPGAQLAGAVAFPICDHPVWGTPLGIRYVDVIAWIGTPGLGEGTFASISTAEFMHIPGIVEIEFFSKALGGKSLRARDRIWADS